MFVSLEARVSTFGLSIDDDLSICVFWHGREITLTEVQQLTGAHATALHAAIELQMKLELLEEEILAAEAQARYTDMRNVDEFLECGEPQILQPAAQHDIDAMIALYELLAETMEAHIVSCIEIVQLERRSVVADEEYTKLQGRQTDEYAELAEEFAYLRMKLDEKEETIREWAESDQLMRDLLGEVEAECDVAHARIDDLVEEAEAVGAQLSEEDDEQRRANELLRLHLKGEVRMVNYYGRMTKGQADFYQEFVAWLFANDTVCVPGKNKKRIGLAGSKSLFRASLKEQ